MRICAESLQTHEKYKPSEASTQNYDGIMFTGALLVTLAETVLVQVLSSRVTRLLLVACSKRDVCLKFAVLCFILVFLLVGDKPGTI